MLRAGEAIHGLVRMQTGLGPRVPGTPAHDELASRLARDLARCAARTERQEFPVAFRGRAGGGIIASLGVSLTLGFAYWVVISVGISLGHAAKLPPLAAAWLPNAFFLALAAYLWLNLEQ